MSIALIPSLPYRYDTDFIVTALSGATIADTLPPAATIAWFPITFTSGEVVLIDESSTHWSSVSSASIAGTSTPYNYGTCGLVSEISSISGSFLRETGRFGILLSSCGSFEASANFVELGTEFTTILTDGYNTANELVVSAVRETALGPAFMSPAVSGSWISVPTGGVSAVAVPGTSAVVFGEVYPITAVSSIRIGSDIINSTYTIRFTTVDPWRRSPSILYETTPTLSFDLQESISQPTQAGATAYVNRIGDSLNPSALLTWSADPAVGAVFLSGGIPAGVMSGGTTPTVASMVSSMQVSALDLSSVYTITLSSDSYLNTFSETFKPYKSLTTTSSLCATTATVSVSGSTQEFIVDVKGITDGIKHNLDKYQPIGWVIHSAQPNALNRVLTRDRYGMLYDFFPATPYSNADNLDQLRISVESTEWDGVNTPGSTLYTLTVSAVSVEYDVSLQQDIVTLFDADSTTLEVFDSIPAEVYTPKIRLNYEPVDTSDIYRQWTTSYTLTVFNESTFPSAVNTGTAVLHVGPSSIPLAYDFTNTVVNFETSNPQSHTVYLETDVAGPGWLFSVARSSNNTRLHLVSDIPVADFVVYPSLYWDELSTQFNTVTSLSNSPGPSSYDFCHTEVFNLSAAPVSGANYSWQVANQSALFTPSSANEVTASIQTTVPETFPITLRLVTAELPINMPVFYFDDVTGDKERYANNTVSVPITSSEWITKGTIVMAAPATGTFLDASVTGVDIFNGAQLYLYSNFESPSSGPLTLDTQNSVYLWSISGGGVEQLIETNSSTALAMIPALTSPVPVSFIVNMQGTVFLSSKDAAVNDFCSTGLTVNATTSAVVQPIYPAVFTSNYFVLTGEDVDFYPTGVTSSAVSSITWDDSVVLSPQSSYTTQYTENGRQDVNMRVAYESVNGLQTTSFKSSDIVEALPYFQQFDDRFTRVPKIDAIALPNDRSRCRAPSNEWLTADNVSNIMSKLWENIEYLEAASQIYSPPPSKFFGWLGAVDYNGYKDDRWHTFHKRLDHHYNQYTSSVNNRFTNLRDVVVADIDGVAKNTYIVSNTTSVKMLSSDVGASQVVELDRRSVDDSFASINTVAIDTEFDTNKRVYMLDRSKNRVMVFQYNASINEYNLLYFWGGLGSINATGRFNQPRDIMLSSNNNIWVADTGNRCVKRYSRTGSWINTDKDFEEAPISIAQQGDVIAVACTKSLVLIQEDSRTIVSLQNTPVRIRPCVDGGYFYLVYPTAVHKIRTNGSIVGVIAADETEDYRSVFHDKHRNLYIVARNKILKYVDRLELLSLRADVKHLYWPKRSTQVTGQEYVQDWVYTRIMHRMYDNIELLRRSINGKFDYVGGMPVVRTLRESEYRGNPHDKSDIIFGINELVTADVFNRNIDKLFDCINAIVEMVQE